MTDATLQIKGMYKELRDAVIALQAAIHQLPGNDWKKTLVNELVQQLPDSLTTLEEFKARLKQVDLYLGMQRLLMKACSQKDEKQRQAIQDATKRLIDLRHQIAKLFPQDFPLYIEEPETGIDLSQLDDIELPCQDKEFFTLIKDCDLQVAEWTRQLLKQCPLDLTTNDVKRIIRVWGAAVHTFVEDARKQADPNDRVLPGTPITLSRFLCIHDELEALYDELSDVAVASV